MEGTADNNKPVQQTGSGNNLPEKIDEATIISFLDAMGIGKKLTEGEKTQFIQISKAYGLNPFKREIHVSKYGEGENAVFSIVVGYESYIKRAERSGKLEGWSVSTSGTAAAGDLRAKIIIHRSDRKHPFEWEIAYSEYVQMRWDKDLKKKVPFKIWGEKPETMTKKVVMAQGFRLCFSEEIGGMPYTSEETIDTQHEVIDDEKMKLTPEQKAQLDKPGDATLAVNDDMTPEKRKQIEDLLKENETKPFLAPQHLAKITAELGTYNTRRADDCISFLKSKKEEQKLKNTTINIDPPNETPPVV